MTDNKEIEVFDSVAASEKTGDMWLRFGHACEDRAMELLMSSPSGLDLETAKKFAQHAEAAYWQSTGEAETFDFDHPKL